MLLSTLSPIVLLSGIFNAILGVIVLLRAQKRKQTLVFSLCAFVMALWAFELFLFHGQYPPSADFWIKVTYVTVWIMNSIFIYFSFLFPFEIRTRFLKVVMVSCLSMAIILIYFIFFTNTFIEKTITHNGWTEVFLGPAHLGFQLGSGICYTIFGVNILQKLRNTKGIEKLQLQLLMAGIFFYSIPVVILTVILPTLFNNTRLLSLSPITSFIFTGFMTYSIIRYRFLGVKFFIGKFLYYSLITLVPFTFFYLTFFLQTEIWGSIFATGAIVSGFGIALVFVYTFAKLDEIIRKFLEKTLIYAEYDPFETINKLLRTSSTELGMDKVVMNVLAVVRQTFNCSMVGLVLFDRDNRKVLYKKLSGFDKKAHRNMRDLLEVVNFWDFQEQIGEKSEILVFEELIGHPKERTFEEEKRLLKIIKFMREEKIAVLLPLNRKAQLNGLMLVGRKEHEDAFTVQDINLLDSIVANASVAVGRGLLYKEAQDLTQNLEEKVEIATKELQDKVEDLELARQRESDLLDILGHELRTPLSIIKSAIGLIRLKKEKGVLTDEDIDKNIDAAEESLEREIKIVDALLGATKLEANRVEINPEEVDIIDVIEDGLAAHKREIEKKGLKSTFKKPKDGFPHVYADRTKIQEVFDNLLSNAVKYTNHGGIEISLKQDADFFTYVSVKDTGIGIPKEELKKLGTKFYRVKHYSKKAGKIKMVRPGGSGLGLYVTFGYVRAMGGDVKVKSKVGKGSTFTFSAPKYRGQKVKATEGGEKDVFKRLGLTKKKK